MVSVRASGVPLYGTWTTSTPAASRNFSALMCVPLPVPADAKLSVPGCCFARAIRSDTDLMPESRETTASAAHANRKRKDLMNDVLEKGKRRRRSLQAIAHGDILGLQFQPRRSGLQHEQLREVLLAQAVADHGLNEVARGGGEGHR